MGPNGPHFELIFLASTGYEGQIGFRFTFVHKRILVIMQGYIGGKLTRSLDWTN